jgi:cytidine deaminase
MSTAPTMDWATLRAVAADAAQRAYAPYSGFQVGAAGLTEDGQLVIGCNVENASYGVTLCAECGLVSAYIAGLTYVPDGEGLMQHALARAFGASSRLVAVAVCGPEGNEIAPCGRCRQLLFEVGGPELVVNEAAMSEWLPGAFGSADLEG